MRPRLLHLLLPLLCAVGAGPLLAASTLQADEPRSQQQAAFFEARVRQLFLKHCTACHSQKISQGGLRLYSPAALLKGGDAGPVVIPGKPDESRLIQAVRYHNPKLRMPPAAKLSAPEIEALVTWVRDGAVIPKAAEPGKPAGPLTLEQGRRFWAFRPLTRAAPPKVRDAKWPLRRSDAFILARLEKAGMRPSPRADRRTLIRRAYFDLVGLPPAPEEVDDFVRDPDPQAYPKLVERLLASPHYGERWARHWLDLVRYCDVPEAWAVADAQPFLYRDWVVRALNEDLPYDRFVQRQLAADEMPGLPPSEVAALGFLGLSPTYWKELKLAPDVIKTVVAEEWEERINTVTGTVLGLTVACARCHDHKFDPISTQDYYALAGIFASTRQGPRPLLPEQEARRVLEVRDQIKKLEAEAKQLTDRAKNEKAQAEQLGREAAAKQAEIAGLRGGTPHLEAPTAYAVETASLDVLPDGPDRTRLTYRDGAGTNIAMQIRGNPARAGQVVPRRFLSVLSPGTPPVFNEGSGRRQLGEAMFREGAALAARVIVNRVWKHHFGRGLVETPSNFGVNGDRPSHPDLLDDLAARFIDAGWSLKWLHRELMLSAAYQQSSGVQAFGRSGIQVRDPDNRLMGRMARRRLEVEAWRDAILSASGSLDLKIEGAPQPLSDAENRRRTLYGTVTRRDLDDLLRLYDFPDPTAHSPARFHTTTPLQQLYVLNSEFIGRQASALARRVRTEAPGGPVAQIDRAYRLLYGRPPAVPERDAGLAFLTASPTDAHWQEYAEVLLAGNELMYVE